MGRRIHWEIFDRKRRALLPKLRFLKDEGFYLAGGTALALQIKHRKSADFDFYTLKEFDGEKIFSKFRENSKDIITFSKAENTLFVDIEGIEVSLFTYQYKLLRELVDADYLNLASIEDIAAMKLIAITQRGLRRDFFDMYFLIKLLGLPNIFELTKEKYPPFNSYWGLRAITYFADTEKVSPKRKIIPFEPLSWNSIKDFIIIEAERFRKSVI